MSKWCHLCPCRFLGVFPPPSRPRSAHRRQADPKVRAHPPLGQQVLKLYIASFQRSTAQRFLYGVKCWAVEPGNEALSTSGSKDFHGGYLEQQGSAHLVWFSPLRTMDKLNFYRSHIRPVTRGSSWWSGGYLSSSIPKRGSAPNLLQVPGAGGREKSGGSRDKVWT